MEKIKVYIFNGACRAAFYGIGTYINVLKEVLKKSDIDFCVVNLFENCSEIKEKTEKGCHTIDIPYVRFNNLNSQKHYSRNVAYLLKDMITEEKDTKLIFHLNFMTDPDFVSALKKMFTRCKVILVAHYTNWSFELMGDKEKLLKIWNKKPRTRDAFEKTIVQSMKTDIRMIRKVDKLVCIAEHTLKTFRQFTEIENDKGVVINNALQDEYQDIDDDTKIKLKEKYKIAPHENVLLFVGRLDAVKGISSLLEAFGNVVKDHSDAHLFLIGDGDYNLWLKCAKDNWARVSFTGHLEKEQVYDFYKMADIGIVSSLHEEFGLVAIEMMMNKIPIIVGDAGGLSEIVEDNFSGLKVPVCIKDEKRTLASDVMAEKICELLDHGELAQRMAGNGRSVFLKRFCADVFAPKMLDLYHQV